MEPFEQFDHKGVTVKLFVDDDPVNPRKEFDNLGHMVCAHRRYRLGDEELHHKSFADWDEVLLYFIEEYGARVILPLYLYDHSGITMRTSSFPDPWDLDMVGVIYVTADKIRKEYGKQRISKKLQAQVTALLEGEVKIYDMYLTGDIWGYQIEDAAGQVIESLWGMFGLEYARQEASAMGDWLALEIIKEQADDQTEDS